MTKIALISTSPRRQGNTALVMTEIAAAIEKEGGETVLISFHEKQVGACTACDHCAKQPTCRIDDDFNAMLATVKECDGLIIGAPVYFGTARGDCMNFLQRLGMVSNRNGRFLEDKVGGPLAVARRGGHTASIQEMLMFFLICGMIVPGANYWNIGFGQAPGEVIDDEEGMANFRTFGRNVYRLAAKLKA